MRSVRSIILGNSTRPCPVWPPIWFNFPASNFSFGAWVSRAQDFVNQVFPLSVVFPAGKRRSGPGLPRDLFFLPALFLFVTLALKLGIDSAVGLVVVWHLRFVFRFGFPATVRTSLCLG
jgi:hypothetical protein